MFKAPVDLSLNNIWQSWFEFRRGKRRTNELDLFQYFLENNLWGLFTDLNNGQYIHGPYQHFTVTDNKRRDIAVASVRDRVFHRLVYEYLVQIYDKTFIYDAWSCRKEKGLIGAIARTEKMFKKYSQSFIWRADITKFFDSVKHDVLLCIMARRIKDTKTTNLLKIIIGSYIHSGQNKREADQRGIPIGNLTSQIFANIYLNELDRFVKHILKPQFYLRYGDDFIIITQTRIGTKDLRERVLIFLKNALGLEINRKNDILLPVRRGIHFLGVEIYPTGRRLKAKIWRRAKSRLNRRNVPSYYGLAKQHHLKHLKNYNWLIKNKICAKAKDNTHRTS